MVVREDVIEICILGVFSKVNIPEDVLKYERVSPISLFQFVMVFTFPVLRLYGVVIEAEV